jgi:hypothetical protein
VALFLLFSVVQPMGPTIAAVAVGGYGNVAVVCSLWSAVT